MEDSHVVLKPGTWKSPDPTMTYLAVHDGHGGEAVLQQSFSQLASLLTHGISLS